ncbi:MAG: insulinase family protein [Vicinamibacteria bacterium]|nr:insulinase family protein [Vicinamibacteria bacterium]
MGVLAAPFKKPNLRRIPLRQTALLTALALLAAPLGAAAAEALKVPFEYHKLDNGLKVVLSKDTTAPTATVTVYYNIGFRIEPKGRTGFAHLFEHLMFQGSNNLGKMEFVKLIQKNGGVMNGSTRFDFTNYYQVVPANTVETVLWAEADRMKGLAIDKDNLVNQQGVVKNEVKVNVLNQPYGGFPWIDMPMTANTNWYNAHNFYGDLAELDAATLEDAKKFFETYYAPNNAAVVVSGDIDTAQTLNWIKKYFGSIKASALPPRPDISEPRQEQEKRAVKEYLEAPRPAIAVAYHAPKRMTAEYFAMGLIDQILLQGKDSRLYQALVQEKGYTDDVMGGINADLGNLFDINGPTAFQAYLFHDKTTPPAAILDAFDAEVEKLRTTPIDKATLDLAKVKARSWLYGQMEDFFGFGRANLLASFALFDDDPGKINSLEAEFEKVTPELIMKTAQEYLRKTNRTILTVPGKPEAPKVQKPGVGI